MKNRKPSEAQFEQMYLQAKEERERLENENEQIKREFERKLEEVKNENEHYKKTVFPAIRSMEDNLTAMEEAVAKGTATQEDVANLRIAWQKEFDKMEKELEAIRVS